MSSTADLTHEGYEPWSPSMVREERFAEHRGRGKGLDAEEVHRFQARMGDEIEWLHGRIRDLTQQLQLARAGVALAATGELDVYADLDEQGLQARINAQEEANKIVAEATAMADDIVAEAQLQAEQIEAGGPDAPESEPGGPLPEPEPDRQAMDLPQRIEAWEAEGDALDAEIAQLELLAAAARERYDSVRRGSSTQTRSTPSGRGRQRQGAAQSTTDDDSTPVPTG